MAGVPSSSLLSSLFVHIIFSSLSFRLSLRSAASPLSSTQPDCSLRVHLAYSTSVGIFCFPSSILSLLLVSVFFFDFRYHLIRWKRRSGRVHVCMDAWMIFGQMGKGSSVHRFN